MVPGRIRPERVSRRRSRVACKKSQAGTPTQCEHSLPPGARQTPSATLTPGSAMTGPGSSRTSGPNFNAEVVNDFLHSLESKQWQHAYELMSPSQRAHYSLEDLRTRWKNARAGSWGDWTIHREVDSHEYGHPFVIEWAVRQKGAGFRSCVLGLEPGDSQWYVSFFACS